MSIRSIFAVLFVVSFAGGASAAGNLTDSPTRADLIYDPATGNVQLDATEASGGIITVFQIENGDNTFNTANYNSLTGGNFGGTFEIVEPGRIGDADFTFAGFSGTADLGDIAPTGMTQAQLQAYLTVATYTGQSGSGDMTLDLVIAESAKVPVSSPAGLGVLALLLLGMGCMLQKRGTC